jgi:DNA-binding response OmpR family regulator
MEMPDHPVSGTVLLVSEDLLAGRLWADGLQRTGLEAVLARSPREALHCWEQYGPDLIVIDVSARADGLELCRRLRSRATNPILMLDACGDESQCLAAYAAGADECIHKQVSPTIFLAKVRAWLRHRWTIRAESLRTLQVGDIHLEPARGEVSRDHGPPVRLSALELRVLYLLMSHQGQVLAPEVMVARVWGPGGDGHVQQLRHIVHHLRHKIEADPRRPRTIRTVRGQGYAFVG